jgi:ketosteroid isomerase-like protein
MGTWTYRAFMSTSQNAHLLREVYAELARGNTRALSDVMADDVSWTFPGAWSWAGTWTSKRSVLGDFLRPLMTQFADYRAEADEILAVGDRVIARVRATATTVRGDAYPQHYCFIYTLADGRITEVVEYCDTALVERVLELVSPGSAPPGSVDRKP